MFICYKCETQFVILNDLIMHLKYSHFVSSSDTLQCKQNGCSQLFSTFKAFKNHIQKIHKPTELDAVPTKMVDSTNFDNFQREPETQDDKQSGENKDVNPIPNVADLPMFNIVAAFNDLKTKALQFSLFLHGEDNITRSDVLTIQKQVIILCSTVTSVLQDCVEHIVPDEIQETDISAILKICKNPFIDISTEYLFLKKLKELGLYQEPHRHEMTRYIAERVVKGNPTLTAKSFSGYFMPIRFQVKKFFECPEILTLTLKNTELLLSKNKICNFVNGESYANKIKLLSDKIVIPLFLHFDDYGINNPLGSHATSILSGYYSFPTVPQHLLSQLKFIFNFAFIKSNDYKEFGNELSFYHIIEELTYLETEGIVFDTPELKNVRVHFVLGAISGDNLGLNTVLGFTKSFNSKSFCRACKRTKVQTKKDCEEIEEFLRDEENYIRDINQNDTSETGLREICAFNRIPSFHVLENFVFDLMHDVFEGICHYDVCNILLSLLQENFITIDTLNSRKNLFQYGETEVGYMSTLVIDENRLKSYHLKMSARETWTFIHFLPLMLGDLVPTNNKPWKLLCLLLQVLEKILLPEFSSEDIDELSILIKKHNFLYIKLYGDLKPKHHFLVHYPTLIRKCGPPKYLWSFRFEAKHQSSKTYSSSTSSRINIPYTLAIKAGLKFAQALMDFKHGFGAEYDLENHDSFDMQQLQTILTPTQRVQLRDASISPSGIYHGRKYKSNLYLTAVENNQTKLYKIAYLVEITKESLYVLVNEITINCFDYHFQSFEVGQHLNNLQLKPVNYFTSPPLHLYTSNNGKVYCRNKFL